jgi:sulfur carrier protein ThiS
LEEKRLADQRKKYEKHIEILEKIVDRYMQSTKQTTIQTSIAKLSYRKSESVVVDYSAAIADEYMRTKIIKEADKAAIKEAIKN